MTAIFIAVAAAPATLAAEIGAPAGAPFAGDVYPHFSDQELAEAETDAFLAEDSPWLGQLAAADDDDANDPWESMNRSIFEFNEFFLEWIVRPVATVYVDFVPDAAREALGNLLHNLNTPVILGNDILQGEIQRAWETLQRFIVNSTVGLVGLFDVADAMGIPKHDEDMGQTFAVWGVGEGPYLVLPIFGPSNPRDAIGKFADAFVDPINLWANNTDREYIIYTRGVVSGVHLYSTLMDDLDQIRKTSIDYYAAIRSMYRQKRAAEIRNGEDVDLPPIPDLDLSFDTDEDVPAAPAAQVNDASAVLDDDDNLLRH